MKKTKTIDPKISEFYRQLAKKSVKARHEKLLAKLDKTVIPKRNV